MYGNSEKEDGKTFRPEQIYVTNWGTDVNFCGSYSFYPVKAFAEATFAQFVAPIGAAEDGSTPRVFFAGEAFDQRYSGYVHGAHRSGLTVAKNILEQFQ